MPRLVDRLLGRRQRRKGVGKLVRGDEAIMRALATRRPVKFGMVVVHSGITKGGLEPRLAEVLSAANLSLGSGRTRRA